MFLVTSLVVVMAVCASGNVVKRSDYTVPSYGGGGGGGGHQAVAAGPTGGFYGDYGVVDDTSGGNPFAFGALLGLVPLIVVPGLVLLGLSLLFAGPPQVIPVAGRRKRGADGELEGEEDMTTRINNIYLAVMNSEECMQRIICEAGGVMKDVTAKDSLFSILGSIAPHSFKKYVHTFKDGAYSKDVTKCQKIKCGLMQ